MESQTQVRLQLAGREIVLVGTAHVSESSVQEVAAAIEGERPDTVAIELDEKRLKSLEDPESWRNMDIVKVLREKNGFLMLSNIILASFQKRMGLDAGVKPGDEMLAAINKSKELGIATSMVDRPITVTLRRAWAKNSFWGKCNLLALLVSSAFSKEEISSEQIEKLKVRSEMDDMMEELSKELPVVKEVLIDERDYYLASHIWASGGNKVLAILGAGHLPGVQAHLEKLASGAEGGDCSEIGSVPEPKLPSKALQWLIPLLIVALIAAGFVYGGRTKGFDMLSSWVLWNGILAAIGSLIAAAHPLTILTSFVGAPLTSLCPLIGIGVVAGIVQAIVCKPKVADMESISNDALSVKGFYRNRILRTLMVFLFSSLGSSIGTFVAGATFVKVLSELWQKFTG
ncbi:MAG: TraB/GumN family protein [Treponema sp.]|nr:TraB/GumN family protein [Treponema sp.]MCR5623594.1 TraB/GumN family protein [Treponema sp.]